MFRTLILFSDFLKDLAKLLKSGLSIQEAVDLSSQGALYTKVRGHMTTKLKEGGSLGDLLMSWRHIGLYLPFQKLPILPSQTDFLEALSDWYSEMYHQLKKTRAQLMYPVFLVCILFFLLVIFILLLVPILLQFFADMGLEVPRSIQILNQLRDWLLGWGGVVVLVSLFWMFFGVWRARHRVIKWVLHINEVHYLYLIHLCLSHGVSIKEAVGVLGSEDLRYQKFKSKFYDTGGFVLSWLSVYPMHKATGSWFSALESMPRFHESLRLVFESLQAQQRGERARVLKVLPYGVLVIIVLMVLYLVFLVYLPLLSLIENITL